jgi:ABC-type antimicrobial peptide transport system permease subunit
MADARRFYRALLQFYPARFREEYETPVERQFWDDYREQRGFWQRLAFWLHALGDLAISIPAEWCKPEPLASRAAPRRSRPRFYTTAVLFLAGFALLLAVVGIYGVATYSIAQRTHEIAVRLAVGAAPAQLRTTLMRQSMVPAVVGMIVGVVGAVALGQYLRHLMSSAEPPGLWTCVAAALLLAATASVAVWAATSRVMHVDPMSSLKSE